MEKDKLENDQHDEKNSNREEIKLITIFVTLTDNTSSMTKLLNLKK